MSSIENWRPAPSSFQVPEMPDATTCIDEAPQESPMMNHATEQTPLIAEADDSEYGAAAAANDWNDNGNDDEHGTVLLLCEGDAPSDDEIEGDSPCPSRETWLCRFFVAVSAMSALASALLLLAQVASLFAFASLWFIQLVLRLYVVLFCIMFLLAELQVSVFLERAGAFRSWFHRGFLYSMVGVIGLEESKAALGEAYPKYPSAVDVAISAVLQVSSVSMFCVGILYMIMGAFCLRPVWEDLQVQRRRIAQAPCRR
jgi:hypothetical protein